MGERLSEGRRREMLVNYELVDLLAPVVSPVLDALSRRCEAMASTQLFENGL
jgi:hypothetical protein